jgi:hypothetical protein
MAMELANTRAIVELTKDEAESEIAKLKSQIAEARRKPYHEDIEKQAAAALSQQSQDGIILLRQLLAKEPIDVTTRFTNQINSNVQDAQMHVACASGIVRRTEIRTGAGSLLRMEYVVNPQFRAALQDLLYQGM